ncbi:MAG TPA: tRNA (adenosine(37)-N6)-threonylcarbamoyltransferase complex transferase subunit TsaD [Candidatus Deferrimicrobiaceae bacterium]|nr:tRNA (adenosine(37)-N6)-threonylcarbamoyltransferase complex transferase subunit TsaD [Candidatus Deferrimicrobiaceae bacterium]
MIVLAIETSCDETAAAIVDGGRKILSSVVASQDDVHAPYGGVVPELASRRHLEVLMPVVRRALETASMGLDEVDGLAVTYGPGLVGSLLIGCSAAKAIAYARRRPLVGVNHLEGHIYAAFLEGDPPAFPFLALVVSGGHTALYLAREPRRYERIGQTRDDAAGEAFDKVAKLLGLGFPGGPAIERVAKAGNPRAIGFSTANMSDGAPDFSFSGIKTAVSLHVRRAGALDPGGVADIAASFQATVVKMLVRKAVKTALRTGVRRLVLTGGVAANTALREALEGECREHGWALHVPSRGLCTDNAAMIAAAGHDRLEAGERAPLSLNAVPDLVLA